MEGKDKSIEKGIQLEFQRMLEAADENLDIKKDVFKTIEQIENASILIDLFTLKMARTAGAIVENIAFNSADDVDSGQESAPENS